MPHLEDITGLTGLFDADAWVYPELDKQPGALFNSVWREVGSGSHRHAESVFPGTDAPYLRAGGANARPYVYFSGAANCYLDTTPSGATMASFLTAALGTMVCLVRVKSADPTTAEALWSMDTGGPSVLLKTVGGVPTAYGRNTSGASTQETPGLAIVLNTWQLIAWVHRAGNIYLYVDELTNRSNVASGNSDSLAGAMRIGAGASSLGRADVDIQKLVTYNVGKTDAEIGKLFGWLKACGCSPETTTTAARVRGSGSDQARAVASAREWRDRTPRKTVRVTYPLAALDQDILTDAAIAHPRGLDPEGAGGGWPDAETGRRLMRVIRQTPNWSKRTVECEFADLRGYVANYVESGPATRLASPLRMGSMVLGRAAVRRFLRGSSAWIQDPSSGLVVLVPPGHERCGSGGLVFERAAGNRLLRSCFISGTTGLTLTAGSGTVALDTNPPFLFDTSVQPTQQWLKLTAGNPNTTGPKAAWPTTDVSAYFAVATDQGWLCIDHTDDANAVPKYFRLTALIGGGTTRYLDAATGTWVAGATDNAIPVAPVGTIARYKTRIPYAGGGSITLTLTIGLTNGGVVSRVGGVYSAEIQTKALSAGTALLWPTSWIPTNTTEVVRHADLLSIDDESADGIVNGGQGTLRFLFTPQWSAGDVPAGGQVTFALIGEYEDGAYWKLLYDKDTAAFQVVRVQGGSTYTASAPWVPASGTEVELAMRWCGSRGELGLAPYTISALVNAVKGTDAVLGGSAAAANHLHWHNGPTVSAGGLALDDYSTPSGTVRCIESLPLVLSDRELAARLRRI